MSDDPVGLYDAYRKQNKFLFVVFYRGSWCPFCQGYLRDLESLRETIEAAGGKVLAVTSESAAKLSAMQSASGFKGQTLVDPENLLAAELSKRGIINVAISEHKGYPHGMVQPAVLIGGDEVGVVYQWAIVPGAMNLGGAKDRPVLKEVWENANAKMQGKPAVHKKIGVISVAFGLKQLIFG